MGPSITPRVGWHTGTNPGFRLYHYTTGQDHLNDYDQYYTNLFLSNYFGHLEWQKLYTFTEMYGVSDLSNKSMLHVYDSIWRNDIIYQKNYLFNTLHHFNRKISHIYLIQYTCEPIQKTTYWHLPLASHQSPPF